MWTLCRRARRTRCGSTGGYTRAGLERLAWPAAMLCSNAHHCRRCASLSLGSRFGALRLSVAGCLRAASVHMCYVTQVFVQQQYLQYLCSSRCLRGVITSWHALHCLPSCTGQQAV